MHRYRLGKLLGEGAFGSVHQATLTATNEQVAIKTLKDKCKNLDCMMQLPEVKVCLDVRVHPNLAHHAFLVADSLQALRNVAHENIVKCRELLLDRTGTAHIVFELLPGGNLENLARERRKPFREEDIHAIFFQLLQAVRHMHSLEFMHRDIKPENILLQSSNLSEHIQVKLADLGLAKHCKRLNQRPHTTYVATRWYRSPELLLRIADYSFPSDIWAVGAVMAELVSLGNPLFPGDDEKDQLARICSLRGHPSHVSWVRGERAMKRRRIHLPKTTPTSLETEMPLASLPVRQLILDMLELDPDRRPTASEALQYPLFTAHKPPSPYLRESDRRRRSALETARTRDFPSSRWSMGSDGIRELELPPCTFSPRGGPGDGVDRDERPKSYFRIPPEAHHPSSARKRRKPNRPSGPAGSFSIPMPK